MTTTDSASLPNLFVVGAMKCGTTTLHSYLSAHSGIFMSGVKEPAYFVDPLQEDRSKAKRVGVWNDRQLYLDLFREGTHCTYRGEATTDYTKAPRKTGCASRIHSFNPHARILYVMRDPIERTVSHYLWNVRHERETRTFARAVQADPQYTDVSHYSMQIAPYLEIFGRSRVYCLTLEQLATCPDAEMARLFNWLGLDSQPLRWSKGERLNGRPEAIGQVRFRFLDRIRFLACWDLLGSFVPRPVRSAARWLNEHQIDDQFEVPNQTADALRDRQRNETIALSEMLHRGFGEWHTLHSDEKVSLSQ